MWGKRLKVVLVSLVVLGVMITGMNVLGVIISTAQGKNKAKEIKIKEVNSPTKAKKKKQKRSEKISADWKTWSWPEECGNFEIKYPANWKVTEVFSDELGCRGYLSYSNPSYRGEGVSITFEYTTTRDSALGDIEWIEEKVKKYPEKALSLSILKGIREVFKLPPKNEIEICIHMGFCPKQSLDIHERVEAGIYTVFVSIKDPFNKGYEDQVRQILSSFKIRDGKVSKETQTRAKKKVIPKQEVIEKIPADWKTWSWGEGCGNIEIKYPPDWEISEIYSDHLGCSGELHYGSISKGDRARIRFNYSTTSAEVLGDIEEIEAKVKKYPEKAVAFSVLEGIRKVRDDGSIYIELGFSKKHSSQMHERTAGGIYYVDARISDPFNKGYEQKVRQILSSFKIRGER